MKTTIRHNLLSICQIVPLFLVCIVIIPVQGANNRIPNSFHVEFKGVLQQEEYSFVIDFSNESHTTSENLKITLSMTEQNENNYIVNTKVEADDFFTEKTVNGEISDGKLIVNSKQSMFLVNPDLLIEGDNVLLATMDDSNLTGEIITRTGRPPTSIEGHRIKAIMARVLHGMEGGSEMVSMYGFDPDTGLLVNAAGALSDVLLNEMGIKLILGGLFELVSYSENLNFELLSGALGGDVLWVYILLVAVAISIVILTMIIYKTGRKRKGKRAHTSKIHKLHYKKRELYNRLVSFD